MGQTQGDTQSNEVIITWSTIWVTFGVALIPSTILYLFFIYQRSQDQRKESYSLYEPRHHTRSHRSPQPFAESWWKDTWNISQEKLLWCVGLDSYMYLRLLRMGTRMAAVGTCFSFILIPLYYTGKATGDSTEQFNQWTLARVEQQSNRLWVTAIFWCIFIAFVLHEFWTEWKLFSKNRYNFLANGDPDTPRDFRYAVRVEQLPPYLQTGEALVAYFERLFPGKVRQATVYLHADDLQDLCDERQEAIIHVEKAVAYTKANPNETAPQTTIGGILDGETVDKIEYYSEVIKKLNEEIDEVRASILLVSSSNPEGENSAADEEGKNSVTEQDTHEDERMNHVSSTGTVTFSSLRAKQAALQCEISGIADNMTIFPVADPDGILWDNITVPLHHQKVLGIQVAVLLILGLVFWTIPVSFVISLANLNSILKALGANEVTDHPVWYGAVAGILPVIFLAVFMALIYMALQFTAKHWISFKSYPEVDAFVLFWHQMFQFANVWIILIGGSIFNQLEALTKDRQEFYLILKIIAEALPGASVFFINIVVFRGLGTFGLELSMLQSYGIKLVKNLIRPEALQTQRMLDDAKEPRVIKWGKVIPPSIFVFLVTIMYMPIVPIMEFFALIYFGGSYLIWKHQCLHVYSQPFEGGGLTTWESLFGFLMATLYMGEGVFIVYMGIKKAPGPSMCGFIPLVTTILVHATINRNIRQPLRNLSLQAAADYDIADAESVFATEGGGDGQLYGQPVLKAELEERAPQPYRRAVEDLNSIA